MPYHKFKSEFGDHGSFEVFEVTKANASMWGDGAAKPGWYWWACYPGCLPDGDGEPTGPFDTAKDAHDDAQSRV